MTTSAAQMIHSEKTHHGWAPSAQENVEIFRIGTTFNTPAGPVAVEQLETGDTVLDGSGMARTVVWVRETRQGLDNIAYADAHSVMLDDGRARPRTRFPGIRFVRGRPADAAFQVLFRSVEDSAIGDAPFRHHANIDDDAHAEVRYAAE